MKRLPLPCSGFLARSGLLMLVSVAGFAPLGQAQTTPISPTFRSITVSPKFSPDPLVLKGIGGGEVSASDRVGIVETSTGFCVGFINDRPDHRLVLTEAFSYLSLQVQSPQDTMLVVRGPGGTWCNDDLVGKNPGIAGEWLPGTYEVWVGSYRQADYHPYLIKITEVR
ncbi:hypothetical protein QPK87_16055 [Kamptonema cortianum]|uniref:Peptidase S1 n=2 Tax=Cyanophyceae TaxID=3028117 RepID=A0A1E5QDS8_9CYAN|nr:MULTISPECIES: hypothetical protein [Cyanophyceae]MDA0209024.1 hypothetical protein [Cyanobacteria bacterium FC1]MDK3158071.1 hypothetical protein [Kamptonema cortianum]MDL5057114.1 hypothetical protein [Geitlerinema calcuttense NRMC-F 0142]OEJ72815.1 hypothetical protein BH720_22855 [Desertifilum tharense IPPAS B-1220]